MNSKQYNNIINHTLVNEQVAQTGDSLAIARAIFNNMGVALPSGDLSEIMEVLETDDYMGWRACTSENAQRAANSGIAAIGIGENQIVVVAAEDEEGLLVQTASVMTVDEMSVSFDTSNFQYYVYYVSSSTTWYIQAIMNTADVCIFTKPEVNDSTNLRDADRNPVKLKKDDPQTIPLMQNDPINVNGCEWYRILYNGMVTYVAADCCTKTEMLPWNIPAVKEMEVDEDSGVGLAVRSTPFSDDDDNLITRLPDRAVVEIMYDVKQNGKWYAVRATTEDGETTYGWSSSTYLKEYVDLFAHSLTPSKILAVLDNIDNCSTSIITASRKPAAKGMARVLLAKGYAPSLVAGVIGNIVHEGDIGHFESAVFSDPSKKKDYLVYMDTNYNGLNFYTNNYSNKKIYNVNFRDAYNMIYDIHTRTNGTWKIDNSRLGFGLGCIQWTFGRTYTLANLYLQEANGADMITEEQAANAEAKMIEREFEYDSFHEYIKEWAISMEATDSVDTVAAAEAAGRFLCVHYLSPSDPDGSKANARSQRAGRIFSTIMAPVI